MLQKEYTPPWWLSNGTIMTLYTAMATPRYWETTIAEPEPPYQEKIFTGAQSVPIFGIYAIPKNPRGTIVATYGITGELDNQWFLRILGRKAYARGYAVVLFDWRAHGKTAKLSSTLTSDGLQEGEDFVCLAAEAKQLGCPAPFWFMGYSLGGQLALWGVKAAQSNVSIENSDIGGGAVICPNLDSDRSLSYLVEHTWGKYLEQAIAKNLRKLAWQIHSYYPEAIDPAAIGRAKSIWDFDREFVIDKLGFASPKEYYDASNALNILPELQKSTLIIYAADDPLFDPTLIADLENTCQKNSAIELMLTQYGGHVAHLSSKACQQKNGDPDCWWSINRVLEWCDKVGH